jgi:hypothetical protein
MMVVGYMAAAVSGSIMTLLVMLAAHAIGIV